jgi:hypothetical protein
MISRPPDAGVVLVRHPQPDVSSSLVPVSAALVVPSSPGAALTSIVSVSPAEWNE